MDIVNKSKEYVKDMGNKRTSTAILSSLILMILFIQNYYPNILPWVSVIVAFILALFNIPIGRLEDMLKKTEEDLIVAKVAGAIDLEGGLNECITDIHNLKGQINEIRQSIPLIDDESYKILLDNYNAMFKNVSDLLARMTEIEKKGEDSVSETPKLFS